MERKKFNETRSDKSRSGRYQERKTIEEIEHIFHQNHDTINQCVASFDVEELSTMNASQLNT